MATAQVLKMPHDKPTRGQRIYKKAFNEGKGKNFQQENAEIATRKLSGASDRVFSPVHSEHEGSGDDKLRDLQAKVVGLESEKKKLRKEQLKDELRRKIDISKAEVKRLKDPSSSSTSKTVHAMLNRSNKDIKGSKGKKSSDKVSGSEQRKKIDLSKEEVKRLKEPSSSSTSKKVHAEFERIRESGRERLLQLAQPKEPKTEWYTSVGPHVRWGTQEMIWPIKKETLERGSTERLDLLALPKVSFMKGDKVNRSQFFFSCGRSSVIWRVKPEAKEASATERLQVLAEPKRAHPEFKEDVPQFKYSCGRQSPIKEVDRKALSCGDRPLTLQLAKHKTPHRDFKPERPIQTPISHAAMKAEVTERLLTLSTPKPREEGPFREPIWNVPSSAKNASASTRCLELARPKGVVDDYKLPRDEQWPVTRAAKRATSSSRIEELSKPIVRATMDHVQFNPDAFLVKPLALKGSFPPRVEQLSRPIER